MTHPLKMTPASWLFRMPKMTLAAGPAAPATRKYKSSPPNIERMTPEKAQAYLDSYDPATGTIQAGRVRRKVTPEYYEELKEKVESQAAGMTEPAPVETETSAPAAEATGDIDGDGVDDGGAAAAAEEVSTESPMTISKAQFAKLLHNPQLAQQTLDMYRATHPEFAAKLEKTLQKYQWAANPQEASPQGTAQDADPNTPGFQPPEWASPEMQQRMQAMREQNARNKQFDEWAAQAQAQGFTEEQIAQLRQQYQPQTMPQQQQYPMVGTQFPQQQQQQPPQQRRPLGRGLGEGIGRAIRAPWEIGKGFMQGLRGQPYTQPNIASNIPKLTAYAGSSRMLYNEADVSQEPIPETPSLTPLVSSASKMLDIT